MRPYGRQPPRSRLILAHETGAGQNVSGRLSIPENIHMVAKIAALIAASLLPITAFSQQNLLQSPLHPNAPPLNVYLHTSSRDARYDFTVIYRPDGTYDLSALAWERGKQPGFTTPTIHGQWWFEPSGKFCFMNLGGHRANQVICRRNRLIGRMRFDGTNIPPNDEPD